MALELSRDLEVFDTQDAALGQVAEAESSTTPEPRGGDDDDSRSNEHIESTCVPPETAFECFAGKIYDPRDIDFSDSLSRQKLSQIGGQTTHSSAGAAAFLTPMQKLSVLKHELSALEDQMKSLAIEPSESVNPAGEAATVVLEESKQLWKRMDVIFETHIRSGSSDVFTKQIDQHLQDLSSAASLTQDQRVSDNHAPCSMGSSMQVPDVERWIKLEKRIANLEQSSGVYSNNFEDFGHENIIQAVSALEQRLDLLDSNNLDIIERKSRKLQSYLKSVETRSSALRGKSSDNACSKLSDDEEQLQKLLESVNKFEDVVSVVPNVVARLRSLQSLHDHGGYIVSRISQLEEHGRHLDSVLDANVAGLEQLGVSMTENASLMKANCESIQRRLEQLL